LSRQHRDGARRRDPADGERMSEPATLGRGLGRSFAIATILGMLVYAVVTFGVYFFTELDERCEVVGEIEDPPLEILGQVALAFGVAAPLCIMLSVALGRRLTRDTRTRLDEVISSAQRMTGERLDERLPISDGR